MSYENFAVLYDELMRDVPYDQWIDYVKKQKESFGISGNKYLDLACGTGEVALRMAKEGFSVTGVDLSAEMLTVAKEKVEKSGFSLFFVQQNIG